MREFAPSLLEPFGLRAKRSVRAYGAFLCETEQGCIILKKTTASPGELWFAHGFKEHLAKAGFDETDRFYLTTAGEPYAVIGPDVYTVRQWGHGEEPDLQNPDQVRCVAAVLGRMGRCSRDYTAPEPSRCVNRYREASPWLSKQRQCLERYARNLRKNGRYTEFDLTLLECLPLHMEQAREAERMTSDPEFDREAEQAEQMRLVAHHRFSNHSVLCEAAKMRVTEFEQACYGMPIFDLAGFMEKTLRKNHWDERFGLPVVEAYDEACPLSPIQKQILYARLLFPGRLIELCHEAYHVRRRWTPLSYGQKLSEIRAQQEERQRFLERFRIQLL